MPDKRCWFESKTHPLLLMQMQRNYVYFLNVSSLNSCEFSSKCFNIDIFIFSVEHVNDWLFVKWETYWIDLFPFFSSKFQTNRSMMTVQTFSFFFLKTHFLCASNTFIECVVTNVFFSSNLFKFLSFFGVVKSLSRTVYASTKLELISF